MKPRYLLALLALSACEAEPLELEGRACAGPAECVAGYVCDEVRRVCVRPVDASQPLDAKIDALADAQPVDVHVVDAEPPDAPGCGGNLADCDGNPDNGCETDVSSSVAHCGACGRGCSAEHVESSSCSGGRCTPSCELGFASCSAPDAPLPDDGCETDALSAANCGGCGNACGSSIPSWALVCGADARCACAGNCSCDGAPCAVGEVCEKKGAKSSCVCNGAGACAPGESCCVAPNGCRNLQTDPASCGACGRSCAPGLVCVDGECRCDDDGACNAGSAGTCDTTTGRCVCAGQKCGEGKRCQAASSCG